MSFRALMTRCDDGGKFSTSLETLPMETLGELVEGLVRIRVNWSSLNYKDALSSSGHRGVTRNFPHIPGVDAAGVVEVSNSEQFAVGQSVLVTGYDLGMNSHGGLSEYIQVPAEWVLAVPAGLTEREAMSLGTAGLTAGLCIQKLLTQGLAKGAEVLVSGASGGVGSIAVALLSQLGYRVTASSGKESQYQWLKELGAVDVISRQAVLEGAGRALLKPRWDAALDTVGGECLAAMLKAIKPAGSVSCCGLTGGDQLPASIYPFILRGVNLLGVDSVEIDRQQKLAVWQRFATQWKFEKLAVLCHELKLADATAMLAKFLEGRVSGRVLIDCR